MQTNTIIVGQGICGTFLGWYLQKAGIPFIMMDDGRTNCASRVASGMINPVTGRRLVKTWMIDELLPFLLDAYGEMANQWGISCLGSYAIVDFFSGPETRLQFLNRMDEGAEFLELPKKESSWTDTFAYSFGFGEITPAYLVDLSLILTRYRKDLQEKGLLLEAVLDPGELVIRDGKIRYADLLAERIVFCDGTGSLRNPYFKNLPFAPNKGEALILEIPDLPANHIYKKGIYLVPWKPGQFWAGSSYEWDFDNEFPTPAFRNRTEKNLSEWLRFPYRVLSHVAGIRPATLERRPFVGFHPLHKNIGILNGMGTKGCSLAPYFARQMAENILENSPIAPEADIHRFSRILGK